MGMIRETWRPWTGVVTAELRDEATGALLHRATGLNAYCDAAAADYASMLAGTAKTLTISHIDVGYGGPLICACDSTSGWTGSPTLDTSVYREGTGSLKGSAVSSGTSTYYHATSASGSVNVGVDGAVDLYLRLTTRSATDLTASYLRVYTTSTSNYRRITFAAIETATGLTLADATWVRLSIPASDAGWTTGAGTPDWTNVTGMGIVVKASGAPTAEVYWDQVLGLPYIDDLPATLQVLTATPGSRGQKAITAIALDVNEVTTSAAWSGTEIVGDFSYAGVYANSGSTLVGIVPLAAYKAYGAVLTVRWTITINGG